MNPPEPFDVKSEEARHLAFSNTLLRNSLEFSTDSSKENMGKCIGYFCFGMIATFVQSFSNEGDKTSVSDMWPMMRNSLILTLSIEDLGYRAIDHKPGSDYASNATKIVEIAEKEMFDWIRSSVPFEYPWGKFLAEDGKVFVVTTKAPEFLDKIEKATVVRRWGKENNA